MESNGIYKAMAINPGAFASAPTGILVYMYRGTIFHTANVMVYSYIIIHCTILQYQAPVVFRIHDCTQYGTEYEGVESSTRYIPGYTRNA